jgi:hypothetical protein
MRVRIVRHKHCENVLAVLPLKICVELPDAEPIAASTAYVQSSLECAISSSHLMYQFKLRTPTLTQMQP